ncbi:MAG: hypothetical protein ACJAXJ_001622 [Colwellia sp.]|jgi:hypothetical protein
MNKFSVNQLIEAIHLANNLIELKRMVGPSESELDISNKRLAKIETLFVKHYKFAVNEFHVPRAIRIEYRQLIKEQSDYEAVYN